MQQYYGDEPHFIVKKRKKRAKTSRCTLSKVLAFVVGVCFVTVIIFSFVPQTKSKGEASVTVKGARWYFVSFAAVSDYEQAVLSSEALREAGGGGYIVNDGTYHVTGAVYSKKSSAAAVVAKQTAAAELYELEIPTVSLRGTYDKDVLDAFSIHKTVYDELSGLVDAFDNGTTTGAVLRYALEKLQAKLTSAYGAVSAESGKTEEILADYLKKLSEALSVEDNEEKSTVCARFRYALCEIVYLRCVLSRALLA